MRVLLLGASGMLGHDLRDAFADTECLAWGQDKLDLTDEQMIGDRIAAVAPALVVNAAAFTDVDRAEEESEEADAVNGYAVGALAVACAARAVPLVHLSTEMVFGQEQEGGYTEDDEPERPLNAYGRSKLLGETLLRDNTDAFWLVRTAWLFGGHGRNFFTKIAEASRGMERIPVVADVVGSPAYTKDVAAGIRALVRDQAPFGAYHLVNSGTASRAALAETFFRLRGSGVVVEPTTTVPQPGRAHRQRISILQNTKRPPLRPWTDALAAYVTELT